MDLAKKKQKLYNSLKKRGLLWSYDTNHINFPDDILLEHVMKYGDVDDIGDDSIAHLDPVVVISKKAIRDFLQQSLVTEGLLL